MNVLLVGFSAALIGLGIAYAGVVGSFAHGFLRVLREAPRRGSADDALPAVSVIVPARDEAAVIERCLTSILRNDYPEDRYEVIVVDDLSEDDTAEIVRTLAREVNRVGALVATSDEAEEPRLQVLQMPENLDRTRAHKKRAITKGIAQARGEIILTTDADCVVPQGWVRAMASAFEPETGLVSGPVLYPEGDTAARRVQALEFLGLVAVGAGAIGSGRPNLCNGANVAYRKEVFDTLGGFEGIDHVTSGDDELLMQKIATTTDWGVRFCADHGATVVTDGAPTLRAFFEQRRRWASKGGHYPDPILRTVVATIYLFYVALLAGAVAAAFAPVLLGPLAVASALKIVPEAALLGPACRHFGRSRLMAYFLPAQVLHVPYIVAVGAAGALGGYTWKGRRIDR
jgi:cellulose synthase/poly-beta-1,6-N-acetylglucosamine synthase-like glycosyltransferase